MGQYNFNDLNNLKHNRSKNSMTDLNNGIEEELSANLQKAEDLSNKYLKPRKSKKTGKKILIGSTIMLAGLGLVVTPAVIVYKNKNEYVIEFKNELESFKPFSVTVKRGTIVSNLKNKVENLIEGHTLVGLYKDEYCTVEYTENDKVTKNTIVYLKYEINKYSVSWPTSPLFTISYASSIDPQNIPWNEDFIFCISSVNGANLSGLEVIADGITINPDADGWYSVNVSENTFIDIKGVELYNYTISATIPSNVEIRKKSDNFSTLLKTGDVVQYGEKLKFSYTLDEKHLLRKFSVNGKNIENEEILTIVQDIESIEFEQERYYNIKSIPTGVTIKKDGLIVDTDTKLYAEDILTMSVIPQEGYELQSFKISGVEELGNDNYKVVGEITIEVIQERYYNINSIPTGVTVTRNGKPVDENTRLFKDDVLVISYKLDANKQLKTFKINNISFTDLSVEWTIVDSDVQIVFEQESIKYVLKALPERIEVRRKSDNYILSKDELIEYGEVLIISYIKNDLFNLESITINDETEINSGDEWVVEEDLSIDCSEIQILLYEENENGDMVVVGYDGITTEIVVPATYNGKPVVEIANGAFENNANQITSLKIAGSVKKIGDLANITVDADEDLGFNIEAIQRGLYFKNLTTLELNDGLETISDYTFYLAPIEYVNIPTTMNYIGIGALLDVKKVNINNLSNWFNITFLNINANPAYNKTLYVQGKEITDLVIPNDVTVIKDYTLCFSGLNSVKFHDNIVSYGRIYISKDYYQPCDTIYLPNLECIFDWDIHSVSPLYKVSNIYIGDELFDGHYVVPDNITTFAGDLFTECYALKSVTLHEGITSITHFDTTMDLDIYIPSLKSYLNMEHHSPRLWGEKINLYFGGNLAENLTIPADLQTIPPDAFRGISCLKSVTIESALEFAMNEGNYAFAYCDNLKKVTINKIPSTLNSCSRMFYNCQNLEEVYIGASVGTFIARGMFEGCSNLKKVTIDSSDQYLHSHYSYSDTMIYEYAEEVRILKSVIDNYSGGWSCEYLQTNFDMAEDSENINYYLFTRKVE